MRVARAPVLCARLAFGKAFGKAGARRRAPARGGRAEAHGRTPGGKTAAAKATTTRRARALQAAPAPAVVQAPTGFEALWANDVFVAGFWSWALAQVLKVFTQAWNKGTWNWTMLKSSGGMPSSHTSMCVGVTAAVAIKHGVASSLFPACLAFTLVVMYDAAHVRWQAGKHAAALNVLVQHYRDTNSRSHPASSDASSASGAPSPLESLPTEPLKEVLGHTPAQVYAGAMLGIVVAFLSCR